jgi:phage-related protein
VAGEIKPVEFLGTSLEDLRAFPRGARREAGFQIDHVHAVHDPFDWKPMAAVGQGVRGIRLRDECGAHGILYVAKFEDAIYVVHCFHKKTQKVPAGDIGFARLRYRELMDRVRRSRK